MVPETRELELFAQMLERHGATAIRCPMVVIRDVSDAEPVLAWLGRFIARPPDDLVLLTGEGLLRLRGFAQRAGLEEQFITALAKVRKITRGPKPVRRLRELGFAADLEAPFPTTAGVIAALTGEPLAGRRVAVQLYPDNPNTELLDFLRSAGATPDEVLCYAYQSKAEEQRVIEVIDDLAAGRVDLIAFTSSPQVRRLQQVAHSSGREQALQDGLRSARIAAVGPVVAGVIEQAGGRVSISPSDSFHLKPMVNAIIAAIGRASASSDGETQHTGI